MSSDSYHEPLDKLSDATKDMHRAIQSLMEELEAVDWYNQRVDATEDEDLKQILAHNRDEEKEHAAMVLEWIRRKDPKFDAELRDWLFTTRSLAHTAAAEAEAKDEMPPGGGGGAGEGGGGELPSPVLKLSIGSLRQRG